MSITHPKVGNIVWTCVSNHIIEKKEQYEAIELRGFEYKIFEETEGGGARDGLYGYRYLKHIIKLWPGD